MSLTLDDIIHVKFPTDRREGYRYAAVDDFLDRLEPAFAELTKENERLRAEVASGGSGDGQGDPELANRLDQAQQKVSELSATVDSMKQENDRLRHELEAAKAAAPAGAVDTSELERLRIENAHLRGDLESANAAREAADTARAAAESGTGSERLVVTTTPEASPAVTRLVQLATEQADSVVAEAQNEARRKLEEANRQAHEITLDAQTRAERVESEARVNAEQVTTDARNEAERVRTEAESTAKRITSDAQDNAARVNTEADQRRAELFTALEQERDDLVTKVDQLRLFESKYRDNLKSHFQHQLTALDGERLEPNDQPYLLTNRPSKGDSATPRLDALLAESDG